MKKPWGLAALLVAAAASAAGGEDAAAKDKREIEALLRDLYRRPINEIEGAQRFGGRYDPEAGCKVLHAFFVPDFIGPRLVDGKVMNEKSCDLKGNSSRAVFRYPSLQEGPDADRPLPKFGLAGSTVNGGTAVVKVNAPTDKDLTNGRVVYFLKKTDQGWRIVNMLGYESWPLQLPERAEDGPCPGPPFPGFKFARTPTGPEMFEDLPSPCKEAKIAAFNRNGWGKW